jgi:hypothetical protein
MDAVFNPIPVSVYIQKLNRVSETNPNSTGCLEANPNSTGCLEANPNSTGCIKTN